MLKEGAQLQVGLRPIVRGKAHARTEFGAKVHINVITIRRMRKYTQDGLQEYHSSHDYELGTLGLVRIVSIGQ